MTEELQSRHLGPITLDGGIGGGTVDGKVEYAGEPVTVRVEIDYPERFNEAVLEDIDMVLDNLEFMNGLSMDTIAGGLRRENSSARALFRKWDEGPGRFSGDTATFLKSLRLGHISILPDGGRLSAERVVMTYRLGSTFRVDELTVRFLEPTGPELAPV